LSRHWLKAGEEEEVGGVNEQFQKMVLPHEALNGSFRKLGIPQLTKSNLLTHFHGVVWVEDKLLTPTFYGEYPKTPIIPHWPHLHQRH